MALPQAAALQLDVTLDLLLDAMDDQGCLDQDVFVAEARTLIPKGGKIAPFGAWAHVAFGTPNWRMKARAHVRLMVKTSASCTTRFWTGQLYTCPSTGCIWRHWGEWRGEDLWRWEP